MAALPMPAVACEAAVGTPAGMFDDREKGVGDAVMKVVDELVRQVSLRADKPAGPTFKVTSGGVVTATSGTVGGWTLGTNNLTTNYGGNCLALDRYNGRICGTSQYDATNAFFFTLKPAEFAVSHWNPSTSGIYSQFGVSFDMSDPGKKALSVQSSVCDALKVYAPSSAARAVMIYGGAETTGTITAGTYVAAGTYVNATGDIYSGGWGRFVGWNANSGSLSGHGVEIGASGTVAYVQSYDRTNSTACNLCLCASGVESNCYFYAPLIYASNTNTSMFGGPNFAINSNGGTSIDFYSSLASGSWCCHMLFSANCTTFPKSVRISDLLYLDIGASGTGCYHQVCGGNGFGFRFFACGTTARGWLYADNSYFGLLHSGGGYALMIYNGTCDVYLPGKLCYGSMGQISMRHLKNSFTPVGRVLCSIKGLQIEAWKFNSDTRGEWHVGPMAEDWQQAFPWLGDGRSVGHVDSIALLGVQELDARLTDELAAMRRCINDLEKRLPAAA